MNYNELQWNLHHTVRETFTKIINQASRINKHSLYMHMNFSVCELVICSQVGLPENHGLFNYVIYHISFLHQAHRDKTNHTLAVILHFIRWSGHFKISLVKKCPYFGIATTWFVIEILKTSVQCKCAFLNALIFTHLPILGHCFKLPLQQEN